MDEVTLRIQFKYMQTPKHQIKAQDLKSAVHIGDTAISKVKYLQASDFQHCFILWTAGDLSTMGHCLFCVLESQR